MLNVARQLIFAERTNGGFTYTLASRLGAMLAQAEAEFGARDSTYTILGIEFGPLAYPQIWYPNAHRHIVIQLASDSMRDPLVAYSQLAHECVHLLDPTGGASITRVLEEGLAVRFQQSYVEAVFKETMVVDLRSYADARAKVDELLALDPGVVRFLRESGKRLPLLTADELLAACPRASPQLAESLVAPFLP